MQVLMTVTLGVGRTLKRYTKFLVVGTANAVVDLVVLNGLLLLHPTESALTMSLYNTIAVVCAILNSYLWNRHWTFADAATGSRREGWFFLGQATINIVLNDVIMVMCSRYLEFSKNIPPIVSSNAGKGLAMFLSSSVSYLLLRLFVFRGRR